MGCCTASRWQREHTQEHKLQYVDIESYRKKSFMRVGGYVFMYLGIGRSAAILGFDIWTCICLLALNHWTSSVSTGISFVVIKWLFSGCIMLSIVLLAWDWYVARRIIRSGDVACVFTNLIANRWFSVKSYSYFCFFWSLSNGRDCMEGLAFWTYLSYAGYKRLILTELPRQVINGYSIYNVLKEHDYSLKIADYTNPPLRFAAICFMCLSILLWLVSAARIAIASIFYLPLLCAVQSSLEDYVYHKVDKKVEQLAAKKRRQRQADFVRKDTFNEALGQGPTLPNINFDDDVTWEEAEESGQQWQQTKQSLIKEYDVKTDNGSEKEKMPRRPTMSSMNSTSTLPLYEARYSPPPPVPPVPAVPVQVVEKKPPLPSYASSQRIHSGVNPSNMSNRPLQSRIGSDPSQTWQQPSPAAIRSNGNPVTVRSRALPVRPEDSLSTQAYGGSRSGSLPGSYTITRPPAASQQTAYRDPTRVAPAETSILPRTERRDRLPQNRRAAGGYSAASDLRTESSFRYGRSGPTKNNYGNAPRR